MPVTSHRHNRFCPLSIALDVLGDPWSLLVVRGLILGPRTRGSLCQFLTGLDDAAFNERMEALMTADVVRCDRGTPSDEDATFELSDRGAQLAPALQALTRWGLTDLLLTGQTAEAPQHSDRFDQTWTIVGVPDRTDEVYGYTIDGTALTLEVSGVTLTRTLGQPDEPAASLETSSAVFAAVVSGELAMSEAIMRGDLKLSGSPDCIRRMFGAVGFPAELLDAIPRP
jgi:DNA-binding HxlR family transcriptional regulator